MPDADDPTVSTHKRRLTALAPSAADYTSEDKAEIDIIHPITWWIQKGSWPKEYFEQDSETRRALEHYGSVGESDDVYWDQLQLRPEEHCQNLHEQRGGMLQYLLARPKLPSSLRRKSSSSSLETPSDQLPREVKSAPYKTAAYATVLATKGSFMSPSPLGVTKESKTMCRTLLNGEQTVPQNSLFRDDLFEGTCNSVQDRNEAMVVRDIHPLICPPAQILRIFGARHLEHLTEGVNEGWNNIIPFYKTRPQPDYSVGFQRSAFTKDQLEKLTPFVGEVGTSCTSYFLATFRMFFPFLTCEVKCGAAAVDVADRQNLHSMTVAVRAVIELYRSVNREKELDREILAFSISHDNGSVRIFGHYAVVGTDQDSTTFYRHPIKKYDFTSEEGKDKWAAYQFVKNVYDIWMPLHLKRLCSAIDDLPEDLDFEVSQSELHFADDSDLQLFQELEQNISQQSNSDSMSLPEDGDVPARSQESTPKTSLTHEPEPVSKRPRNQRTA